MLDAVERGELTAPGPMIAHLRGSLAALEALERDLQERDNADDVFEVIVLGECQPPSSRVDHNVADVVIGTANVGRTAPIVEQRGDPSR